MICPFSFSARTNLSMTPNHDLNTCTESAFIDYLMQYEDGRKRVPQNCIELLKQNRPFRSWAEVMRLLPQVGDTKMKSLQAMFYIGYVSPDIRKCAIQLSILASLDLGVPLVKPPFYSPTGPSRPSRP